MTRSITLAPGEYYHIYNRGVDKREIFGSKYEYEHFLALMYLCNSKKNIRTRDSGAIHEHIFAEDRAGSLVDICAYCLMPNHFHLLIKEKEEGGISTFMQKLTTAYTMYFNRRNDRSGSLFQGTFKAEHAHEDQYLKYLIAYIHLNPVKIFESAWAETGIAEKKKAEDFLNNYQYSSYQDFGGIQRSRSSILARGSLPEYFSTPISFKENIREWLEYRAEKLPESN